MAADIAAARGDTGSSIEDVEDQVSSLSSDVEELQTDMTNL